MPVLPRGRGHEVRRRRVRERHEEHAVVRDSHGRVERRLLRRPGEHPDTGLESTAISVSDYPRDGWRRDGVGARVGVVQRQQ